MKNIIKALYSLVAVTLFMYCSSPKPVVTAPVERIIEKHRVIDKPFDLVWQKSIELLATYNMPIKNLDKNSGFISTEYKAVTGNPYDYMNCTGAYSNFKGKLEFVGHGGNLNLLIKKVSDDSTNVTVNVFYSATANKYRYASVISTTYVLESSTRVDCPTTGNLERAILEYLSGK